PVLFTVLPASAQKGLSSPYTANGIGYLNRSHNIANIAMGGINIGVRSPNTVNFLNPSALTAIDTLSFVFEGGFYIYNMKLKTTDFSEDVSTASMSHLLFGFPITNWWKSSFGLLPYSSVGYRVIDVSYDEQIGKIQHLYSGDGGISKFFWGNGFQLSKYLSAGFNIGYLFGTVNKYQTVSFPDSAYILNTKTSSAITVNDFNYNFGLQAHFPIKNDLHMSAGVTYTHTAKLKASQNYLARSFYGSLNDIEFFKDTIDIRENEPGKVTLPKNLGLGVTIEKKDRWMVGLDFKQENWSEFSMFQYKDAYTDSYRLSAGGFYIPDKRNGLHYWERIVFRVGGYYAKTNLEIREKNLDEFGITFGLGLPLTKSESMINFAIETGKRGTTANNLIQENFFMFTLGVAVNEIWFYKRRYQ
ncbi:MAG: hypothetical protein K8R53_01530, partial [Bacteroidales bacterium]|nr:hypothetical protein [Bacteroidales bacterium]